MNETHTYKIDPYWYIVDWNIPVFNSDFRFIVNVILARLLYPEEFGIVGLAAIFLGFISTINELGLSAAIIQRKKLDETHLSTSFWASLGMGTMLCIISILVSPFIADFFKKNLFVG